MATDCNKARPLHLNLAAARMARRISLEEIVANTKISRRFLEAIEAEEFEQLPGQVYSISYLRQYAAATEFDVCELLAFYHQCIADVQTEPASAKASRKMFRWSSLATW